MPAFSTRNSTAPPLASLIAVVTSMVTVPTFGFGIMPRGPSTLPRRPTRPIMSGVAMQRSKLISPLFTISNRSSAPTISAPAFFASSALGPLANTATRSVRPEPLGSETTPRTIWSAWRGSTPRLIDSSMVSSNFAVARDLTSFTASSTVYCLAISTPSDAFLKRFEMWAMVLTPAPGCPWSARILRSCASPFRHHLHSGLSSWLRRSRGPGPSSPCRAHRGQGTWSRRRPSPPS